MDYPFTRPVSYDIESKLKLKNLWFGHLVIFCLRNWCLNEEVKHIISLPVIVSWFIWKARNQSCFDDFTPLPALISSFLFGIIELLSTG